MTVFVVSYRFGGDQWRQLCLCATYPVAVRERELYIHERSYVVGQFQCRYEADHFDITEEKVIE